MLDVRERLAVDDLPDRLRLLGFTDQDRADALAAADAVIERPDEATAVQGMAERLLPGIGRIGDPWDGSLVWPWRAEGTDSPYGAGVLEMLALVACVDEVRAYHATRTIGVEDSWRALADLGQQVVVHRLTYGSFGIHTHDWLRIAWSGAMYWLGRLQFNLQPSSSAPSGWVLSTHIPRSGPLTQEAVDASFAWARQFFAEHFPDYPAEPFHCYSWLLDPELAAALPDTSNIARFQRRWTLMGEPGNGDEDAVFFTFARRPPVDLSTLPRDTTLQRAILDRLASGGHWQVRHGRIPFATDASDPAAAMASTETVRS